MVDPADAPGRLLDLSNDVRAAVLLDPSGAAVASSDADHADELAAAARELIRAVDRAADRPTAELEAQVAGGSIYAVRNADWTFVAVARRSALSSLMLYDLRTVLSDVTP